MGDRFGPGVPSSPVPFNDDDRRQLPQQATAAPFIDSQAAPASRSGLCGSEHHERWRSQAGQGLVVATKVSRLSGLRI